MTEVRNGNAILDCNEVFIMKPNYEYLNVREADSKLLIGVLVTFVYWAFTVQQEILTLHWVDKGVSQKQRCVLYSGTFIYSNKAS